MKKLGANLTTLGIAITLLVVICCCAFFAFSALSTSEPNTPEEFAEQYDGSVEAYRAIFESNDCVFLQGKFDTAYNSNQNSEPGTIYYTRSVGFMKASDMRMKEIGCYGNSNSHSPTVDLSVVIKQTADAAIIQTQLAASPTLHLTATSLPTLTAAATIAVIDTLIPPSTILPFNPPTATTFILPTNPPPSGGGGNAICSCSGDLYNCTTDFTTHAQAQACYEYCIAQGAGDIHRLDGDANGLACESLP